jgi:hypothetical protein
LFSAVLMHRMEIYLLPLLLSVLSETWIFSTAFHLTILLKKCNLEIYQIHRFTLPRGRNLTLAVSCNMYVLLPSPWNWNGWNLCWKIKYSRFLPSSCFFFFSSCGLGLLACYNSELLLKLWIIDIR